MKEAEVSIRTALYYIANGETNEDVDIAIDGAQVKTMDDVHFMLGKFMSKIGAIKDDNINNSWQGRYSIKGFTAGLNIHSGSGKGDVVVKLKSGRLLFVESKGFEIDDKGSKEYPKMREAIGQLMTCPYYANNVDLAVAAPDSLKSRQLVERWSKLFLIKQAGIKFILVNSDGTVTMLI